MQADSKRFSDFIRDSYCLSNQQLTTHPLAKGQNKQTNNQTNTTKTNKQTNKMSWSQSFSPLLLGWPIRPIFIFHHPCDVSASFCRKSPKPPGFEGVEIGLWRWRILCSYAAGTGAKAGFSGWLSRDPQRPGYFEDLNTPASYRFRAPSIGRSKILRVIYIIHPGQFWSTFRDVLRAKLVFLWDKMAIQ